MMAFFLFFQLENLAYQGLALIEFFGQVNFARTLTPLLYYFVCHISAGQAR
jgi:hypothetical protein